MTISPAYGRDYKSKKAVLEAWAAGLDFTIESFGPDMGRYINKADAAGLTVTIRYDKLRKVVVV